MHGMKIKINTKEKFRWKDASNDDRCVKMAVQLTNSKNKTYLAA
jgi:hypothetical protein